VYSVGSRCSIACHRLHWPEIRVNPLAPLIAQRMAHVDGSIFDRLVKNLAGRAPRRETLRVIASGGLVAAATRMSADESAAKKKKRKRKKKARKLGQTCGGKQKCSQKLGSAVCQEFASTTCQGVDLSGNRCCGLEGTICDPNFGTPIEPNPVEAVGNCSCCDPLFCGKQPNGEFRCQVEPT
jgi:hypothetical protein